MKFQIRTSVENGVLKRNKPQIIEALNYYEGKNITITIERTKNSRSNQQNRFYWGIVLLLVQNGLKEATGEYRTAENIHYNILLPLFAPSREIINTDTGESLTEKLSSSELSTTQFAEYILEIQRWAAEWLGIVIPDPNSEITLNFNEDGTIETN